MPLTGYLVYQYEQVLLKITIKKKKDYYQQNIQKSRFFL